MANSNTEHSRKLRAKTATESAKRLIAAGIIKKITFRLNTDLANEFDAIAHERGLSRPATLQMLCDMYRQQNAK
ncbi:MAG TPA: hypothetical protein DD666_17005 [Advenella kashmirensis]|uniref:Uncharacterized protein n=1 Tax=Advenella kashmirensis TaxID=310575 RepID=A0A356LJD7_9BURK|nr:hypothetical protein [Advenella kashmirensis]